jgi:hypothetical protein
MAYAYKLICSGTQNHLKYFTRQNWHFSFVVRLFLRENILRHQRHFQAVNLRQNVFVVVAQSRAIFLFARGNTATLRLYRRGQIALPIDFDTLATFNCCSRVELHNLCGLKRFAIVVCFQEISLALEDFVACVCSIDIEEFCTLTPWGQTEIFYFWLFAGSCRSDDSGAA